MSSSLVNSPLDTLTKRFTPCVIICPCDKWLSQHQCELHLTPPQQVTIGPALMEGVERTNAVVVRGAGQGQERGAEVPPRRNSYAMEVDWGRNCYACGGFGHMAHYCRNRGRGRAMEGKRVEYRGGRIEEIHELSNNLKGVENLELLD